MKQRRRRPLTLDHARPTAIFVVGLSGMLMQITGVVPQPASVMWVYAGMMAGATIEFSQRGGSGRGGLR